MSFLTKLFPCLRVKEETDTPIVPPAEAVEPEVEFEKPLDYYWAPSLGFIKGKYSDREVSEVTGICFHTNGGGLWRRWRRDNPNYPNVFQFDSYEGNSWAAWQARRGLEATPFDTAVRVYSSIMDAGPHFQVCGDTGRLAQMCPLDKSAWGVGRDGRKEYLAGTDNQAWLDYWSELRDPTPLALLGGHEWTEANDRVIHVEVSPPRRGPTEPWKPQTWTTLANLVRALIKSPEQFKGGSELRAFKPHRETIVTHWDLHPEARSYKDGTPYDINWKQWEEMNVFSFLIKPGIKARNERYGK